MFLFTKKAKPEHNTTTFQIKQTRSQYAFGSTIQPELLVNDSLSNYGQFMYNNFEWGEVDNGIQWIDMESDQVYYKLLLLRLL